MNANVSVVLQQAAAAYCNLCNVQGNVTCSVTMLRVQGNSIAKLKTDLSLKPYPFALNHNCTFTQESVMCDSTAVVQ